MNHRSTEVVALLIAALAVVVVCLSPATAHAGKRKVVRIQLEDEAGQPVPFCVKVRLDRKARMFGSEGVASKHCRLTPQRGPLVPEHEQPQWIVEVRRSDNKLAEPTRSQARQRKTTKTGIQFNLPGDRKGGYLVLVPHPVFNPDGVLSVVDERRRTLAQGSIIVRRVCNRQTVELLDLPYDFNWDTVDVDPKEKTNRVEILDIVPDIEGSKVSFIAKFDRSRRLESSQEEYVIRAWGMATHTLFISQRDFVGPKRIEGHEARLRGVLRDVEAILPKPPQRLVPRDIAICIRYDKVPDDLDGYARTCGEPSSFRCDLGDERVLRWNAVNRIRCPISGTHWPVEIQVTDATGRAYADAVRCELREREVELGVKSPDTKPGLVCTFDHFFTGYENRGAEFMIRGDQILASNAFSGLTVVSQVGAHERRQLSTEDYLLDVPSSFDLERATWSRYSSDYANLLEDGIRAWLGEVYDEDEVELGDKTRDLIRDESARLGDRLATELRSGSDQPRETKVGALEADRQPCWFLPPAEAGGAEGEDEAQDREFCRETEFALWGVMRTSLALEELRRTKDPDAQIVFAGDEGHAELDGHVDRGDDRIREQLYAELRRDSDTDGDDESVAGESGFTKGENSNLLRRTPIVRHKGNYFVEQVLEDEDESFYFKGGESARASEEAENSSLVLCRLIAGSNEGKVHVAIGWKPDATYVCSLPSDYETLGGWEWPHSNVRGPVSSDLDRDQFLDTTPTKPRPLTIRFELGQGLGAGLPRHLDGRAQFVGPGQADLLFELFGLARRRFAPLVSLGFGWTIDPDPQGLQDDVSARLGLGFRYRFSDTISLDMRIAYTPTWLVADTDTDGRLALPATSNASVGLYFDLLGSRRFEQRGVEERLWFLVRPSVSIGRHERYYAAPGVVLGFAATLF